MNLQKLFLRAFGPFTDTVLDFSGPARLHVVYGPNEAGKSSALRAMGDLRYGIPPQSSDNFVHDFKAMSVAGLFENAAGQRQALARRKGNKDTLLLADGETGAPIAGSVVPPDLLLALTGGVERRQFETMYGLDSAHLREGGRQLISGAGELGTALFEASTGTASVKALLASLQDQAKAYYAPRSQNAQLNEALKQLDLARQRYRQAVAKPEHWKTLRRAHEEAAQQLAALRGQLAELRRRVTTLAGLRAVEPILRGLDRMEQAWATVQHHVALPENARDQRLAAQQQAKQAQHDLQQADAALEGLQQALAQLCLAPALLSHGPAIDRLLANAGLVRRNRDPQALLAAQAQASQQQLLLDAQRLLGQALAAADLAGFGASLPSLAERAALQATMDQWRDLQRERTAVQAQHTGAQNKLGQWALEQRSEAPAPLLDALTMALAVAQGLGPLEPQMAADRKACETAQHKLQRQLQDLGLASVEQLQAVHRLAVADMDAQERDSAGLQKQLDAHQAEAARTGADLAEQKLRRQRLAAVGEVVTAGTLSQARQQRDQQWASLRASFIDAPGADAPVLAVGERGGTPAADRFEATQAEADRQADLLREGAQRAAEVAECAQRIADMESSLQSLGDRQAGLQARQQVLDQAWQERLAAAGLPALSVAAAREWMGLRQVALEDHGRLDERLRAVAGLEARLAAARSPLSAALAALGLSPLSDQETLAVAVQRAKAHEQSLLDTRSALRLRAVDMAEQRQIAQQTQDQLQLLDQQIDAARRALDQACLRLHLPTGAEVDTLKARLQELQAWADSQAAHTASLRQLAQFDAAEQTLAEEARVLAQALQETLPDHRDSWLDSLETRLAAARAAMQQKLQLEKELASEERRQRQATQQAAAAQKVLSALVRQADVVAVDELPEAEARAEQRRQLAQQLQRQQAQLAEASPQDPATLRGLLAHQDSQALDQEKQDCEGRIARLEAEEQAAIATEHASQQALASIDTSDQAAQARDEMEAAMARYRAGVRPWAQLRLAEALLSEALRRHREKAQGPVVTLAGAYFTLMTGGRFERLLVDGDADPPTLLARTAEGRELSVAALSEGTADQLYLSLRLAALELQRSSQRNMPLVLDDVFITADDARAACMFKALEKFATQGQVLLFTHHRHLVDIAEQAVSPAMLSIQHLTG